jgi:hypothetical protein
MTPVRQLLVAALAAATLAITAAPAAPEGPDLNGYDWLPIYGTGEAALSNGNIFAIKSVGADLFLGGDFTDFAGIAAADRIAKWDAASQAWEALAPAGATDGLITAGTIYNIAVDAGVVYVGGKYTVDTGAVDCDNLSTFTTATNTWSGFGTCPSNQLIVPTKTVYTVEKIPGGPLYVGGNFLNADGDGNFDFGIYGTYSGSAWSWSGLGDNGAGGPALSDFVSNVVAHPAGGVLVVGNFGSAGGVTGANSLSRFDDTQTPNWYAQDTPAVSFYGALNTGTELYASGWQGAYLRTGGNSWRALCTTELGTATATWGSLATTSSGLLLVGGNGLYACDTTDGGSATLVPNGGTVRALASYRGATIVGASTILAGGTDYMAVLGDVLPSTNGNSRQATDMVILLATLTALTALAGTQLLRRA